MFVAHAKTQPEPCRGDTERPRFVVYVAPEPAPAEAGGAQA